MHLLCLLLLSVMQRYHCLLYEIVCRFPCKTTIICVYKIHVHINNLKTSMPKWVFQKWLHVINIIINHIII